MHILWIKTELLHPVDKGGKIRTYNMLRELKREHRITYLTLDDGTAGPDATERAAEYCHDLIRVPFHPHRKYSPGFYSDLVVNLWSPLPYAVSRYESATLRRKIEEIVTSGQVDVLVCDFLAPSLNVPSELPCRTVLFQHNVEAMIWRRHFQVAESAVKRAYMRSQWRKMESFEKSECRRYDAVIAVSEQDAETMRDEYGVTNVTAVPTGVDTEYFRPEATIPMEPHGLVFTGSMDWLPNEDAIRYFAQQILPQVRRTVPDVSLTVVGRNPTPGLVELARTDASIVVTGYVDDVRPYIERAAVYVVPIRIGGGTRLKIYEAMAMEKPVVSTVVGAEGLPVKDGSEILLADSPEDFAAAIVRLLEDNSLARSIGHAAATRVRKLHGWDRVAARFAEECERTVLGDPPAASSRAVSA